MFKKTRRSQTWGRGGSWPLGKNSHFSRFPYRTESLKLFKISYVTCTGCRTNSWTTSLCSRDHCCNKSYLCFHKWRSTGYDGTNVVLAFALNTNTLVSETLAPSMLHLIVYTSMQTFKFRSVYTVQLRFQYPQ